MRRIVLASSSSSRKALLSRLGLPFETATPDIDEQRLPGESPREMVMRLSHEKALALAHSYADALIIGSDQCAVINKTILGKPGNFERAFTQLKQASGQVVVFHTGLCLLESNTLENQIDDITFEVRFRNLSDQQISRYLNRDKPFHCAGSFKAESLGVALFERMQGRDPNALIGLPLIRLVSMLQQAGVEVL